MQFRGLIEESMNNEAMVRARRLPDGSIVEVLLDGSIRPFTRRSEWARVDAMTEEEVEANAVADLETRR